MRDWKRTLRNVGLATGLFLFLAGPAPGSVGGCSGSSGLADPVEFCELREAWICARQRARGEMTPEEEQACVDMGQVMCAGFNWSPDCQPQPSQLLVDACIEALGDPGRLTQDDRSFPECDIMRTLCAAGGG